MEDVFERLKAGLYAETPDQVKQFSDAANKAFCLRQRYNSCSNLEELPKILSEILQVPVPENALVVPPFHFDLGFNIHLGKNTIINYDCVLLDDADIFLGDSVLIGPGAKLMTAYHPTDPAERLNNPHRATAAPIRIEDNVWIGGGAIILPGITVGANSIVGAGSVVTYDVEPNTVVAGNPARMIRRL